MLSSISMQSVEATRTTPPTVSPGWGRRALFWGPAIIVVGFDQLTKGLVRGLLERGEAWPDDWPVQIRYVTNTGAAFGILQDQTVFLTLMAFIGLVAIYLYYRFPPFSHWLASVAIGMMLGGAVGNLIDRVRLGRVTDFIDFPHYPAFNVADSSITVGIAILLVGYLYLSPQPKSGPHEDD